MFEVTRKRCPLKKQTASPLWGGRGWVSTGLAMFDSSRLPQFFTLVPTRTNRVAAEALGSVRRVR
jgi:hypothetical protein